MKNLVIFCVDDEKVILDSLKVELKNKLYSNFIIETAESGEEALLTITELINDNYEIPIIISDYLMPKMRGDEFLHKVHEILPEAKKILLTGQANIEAIISTINNASLFRYIEKPWEPNDLMITINEALLSFEQGKQLKVQNAQLLELSTSLEEKVFERTHELSIKNELLLNRRKEIEKQNMDLEEFRNNLETLVKVRTQELLKAKEKAEENDHLKSAFIANISHEIRTPLNGIVGFVKFFKNADLSKEKKAKYIEIIENSSTQLLSIIDDIIQISKVQTNQLVAHVEEVNMNEILENLLANFSQNISPEKNVEIKVSKALDFGHYKCLTDKVKVQQIISNLIGNAIKFTENGLIEFGCEFVEGDKLLFFVKDQGMGIAPEHQEMIFERFRQVNSNASNNEGGTGLGLAISKALVELLGGKIWVESEIGKGSSFFFTIDYVLANNS